MKNGKKKVLEVNNEEWKKEIPAQKEFFDKFGDKLPKEMTDELKSFEGRL